MQFGEMIQVGQIFFGGASSYLGTKRPKIARSAVSSLRLGNGVPASAVGVKNAVPQADPIGCGEWLSWALELFRVTGSNCSLPRTDQYGFFLCGLNLESKETQDLVTEHVDLKMFFL